MKTFSIIIPTLNSERRIESVLLAIKNFEISNLRIEIVLIDNGSSDNTIKIAKKYCDLIEIYPDKSIAELRNIGANLASGYYLGFIDSDCRPSKNWSVLAKNILEDNSKVGIVGSFYSAANNSYWVERFWVKMRNAQNGYVNFLPAGNIAVRKKEFFEAGGFSTDLITGEDYDLCLKYRKSGFFVFNESKMSSIHYGNPKNLRDLFKMEVWYGQGMLKTLKSYSISKPFIASLLLIIGLYCLIFGIICYIVDIESSPYFIYLGVSLIFIPIFAYSIIATIRSKEIFNFWGYLFIFFVYLLGRSFSILLLLSGKKKRLK